jgi:hypothetical protein
MMPPLVALHVTEASVTIKLWRLVVFYCISPHCAGWWIYRPELPANPRVRMLRMDRARWPAAADPAHSPAGRPTMGPLDPHGAGTTEATG